MKARPWRLSAIGSVCLMLAACSSDGGSASTTATEPATSIAVASTTTSAAATTTPSTSAPTTTTLATSTTTRPPSTTTTVAPAVPGRVSGVHAFPGGGSGEVAVNWNAEPDANGYRIYRSATPDGDFVLVADINVTNGDTSATSEVVNIWTAQHSYVPAGGALASRDTSSEFQYVELSGAGERCFKVRAYNDAGRGHSSSVSCSGPV
ncbi:MAG: hypothetical protein K8R99_05340 [Actinomycetia bacterium]|nr:hypothetical protein [Actinomycetes bacterium]